MNALEAASLVMIPSGYENGTLGSLKPLDGTGDFTFSRGSDISATRVNEDGYIEKGYENLLLQSNTFSDADWRKIRTNIAGGQAGYDGTNDAWVLECDEAGQARIEQTINISGVNSYSIYAKRKDSNYIRVRTESPVSYATFNLLLGEVSNQGIVVSSSIEPLANDWYRCTIVFEGSKSLARVYILEDPLDISSAVIGSSVYIQDAMLNQGLVAYPYVETTTAPVAGGILEDMPRLSGSCPALLLEPQRTNLMYHSEYPEGNQFFNNLNPDYNATTSPEGIQNATRITATGTSNHQYGSYPVVSSGVGVVGSVFVKADATEYVQLYFGGGPSSGSPYANFFIGDNPSVEQERDLTASIEDYGNGWLRLIIKQTTDSSGGMTFAVMPIPNGTTIRAASYTANGESIFTYGLQLEQDATYPTSYIPTYGTSQTRLAETLADSIDIGSFTSNYNTLFFDWGDMEGKSTFNKDIVRGWATMDNSFPVFRIVSINDGVIRYQVYASAAGSESANYTCTTRDKAALVLNGLNSKLFINGLPVATFSIDVQQGLRKFNYNGLSRNVTNQFTIFPTALSDDECIALTTIS